MPATPSFAIQQPAALPTQAPKGSKSTSIPVWDRWIAHPGRKLTASKILSAFELAEGGYPQDQCDLFDDRIEADAHLRSALETRVDDVARKTWILVPGGESTADKLAAEALEEALRDVPNMIETLEHLSRANWYGYAYSEIVWERVDGYAVPTWFHNVGPRRFLFDDMDRPFLITEDEPASGLALEPGRWWSLTRSGRRCAAAGLMRTAAWWSHFKTLAARDWLVFANRFGIPNVAGVYDEDAAPETIAVLKDAVKRMGSDGWAVYPREAEIQITETTRTGAADEVHGALLRMCNSEMSKLISGATLMTETQGPGSFALGREHSARAFSIVQGDAERLAESFTWGVGRPFVKFNGLSARPPRLKIHVVQDQDPLRRLVLLSRCANELGVPIDKDQLHHDLQIKVATGEAYEGTATGEVEEATE